MKSFTQYDRENPHFWVLFRSITLEYIHSGRPRISSKLICEEIRWHYFKGGSEHLKMNNNYTAWYARKFLLEFPQYAGFFNLKPLRNIPKNSVQ